MVKNVTQAVTRSNIAVDDCSAEFIEVIELLRRDRLYQRHKIGQLNQAAIVRTHVYGREIGRLAAFVILQLQDDTQLRLVELEIGIQAVNARILPQLAHNLADVSLQLLIAVAVDNVFNLFG